MVQRLPDHLVNVNMYNCVCMCWCCNIDMFVELFNNNKLIIIKIKCYKVIAIAISVNTFRKLSCLCNNCIKLAPPCCFTHYPTKTVNFHEDEDDD